MVSNRRKIILGLVVGLLLLAISGMAFVAGTVWGHRLTARLGIRLPLPVVEKPLPCATPLPLSALPLIEERPTVLPAELPPELPGPGAEVSYRLLRSGEHVTLIFTGRASGRGPLQLSWLFPPSDKLLARVSAGEVVRVVGDTITVRTDGSGQTDGDEQTVHLTECTIWQGAARAATSLRPGDRLLLSGHVETDGSLSAEIVVVLPP
jgi:hypothetical protein